MLCCEYYVVIGTKQLNSHTLYFCIAGVHNTRPGPRAACGPQKAWMRPAGPHRKCVYFGTQLIYCCVSA